MTDELVKKEEVLKIIQDIKCDESIPKNYGTLLDIMRCIRKIPAISTEDVISREDFVKLSEKFDKQYLAKCEEVNRLKADLEQSVRLPCKIGNKVWYIDEISRKVFYVLINGIEIKSNKILYFTEKTCRNSSGFIESQIGKTVFLTREEAQAKLEERKGGSNE